MTRLLCFATTAGLAIGFSAAANADTFSFTVGGHHVTISASRNCYRTGCVSVSVPTLVGSHRKHRDDVVAVQDVAAAKPAPKAPVAIAAAPVSAPAPAPQIVPAAPPMEARAAVVAPASPPSAPTLAASDSKEVAAPSPPLPPAVAPAAPDPAPVTNVVGAVDIARDDTPVGDWQTEGKIGAVRIEACGKALCGYLINPSSQAKAESILINMKPNGDSASRSSAEWRGSIFSRASGNTYNATMMLKTANLLRVEACALGPFFCSGNNWTRIIKEPAALVTSRDDDGEPRS